MRACLQQSQSPTPEKMHPSRAEMRQEVNHNRPYRMESDIFNVRKLGEHQTSNMETSYSKFPEPSNQERNAFKITEPSVYSEQDQVNEFTF